MEDLGGPTNREIINHIIANRLNEKCRINLYFDSDTALDDLGYDSLDVMETIIEAEGAIRKKVDDRRISNIVTVNDIYKLFEEETKH